ncbi:MAG TPA: hypothetical protein VKV40_01160 [Ktedonobacteraceae bacterium]|nr:hypothetical protein [Ktedonobacteraceae bacterium]
MNEELSNKAMDFANACLKCSEMAPNRDLAHRYHRIQRRVFQFAAVVAHEPYPVLLIGRYLCGIASDIEGVQKRFTQIGEPPVMLTEFNQEFDTAWETLHRLLVDPAIVAPGYARQR